MHFSLYLLKAAAKAGPARASAVAMILMATLAPLAHTQVFYPQAEPVLMGPMPQGAMQMQDNLDMSVEVEAFTTNWGQGYTGIATGTRADIALSPALMLGLEGRHIDSNQGEAWEYGAGLTIQGQYGELYAAINGITASGDLPDLESGTWVEVGGDFEVVPNLRLGFEASVPVDNAVIPHEAIYGTRSGGIYR